MRFNYEDEASFFKILLNDLVDYISLPSAFANKYLDSGNKKKQTVVLKNKSSAVDEWRVKYYKIEDRYYLMDGWLDFMKDNGLQLGDFLVFLRLSPSPNLTFQVLFYEPNGSLKPPTIHRRPVLSLVTGGKPRVNEEARNEKVVDRSLKRVVGKTRYYRMPLTKSFVKSAGISGCRSVRLKTKEGKMWKVKLIKYGRTLCITSGWNAFRKDNKIKTGDTCEFSHVKHDLLHVQVFKKKGRPFSI